MWTPTEGVGGSGCPVFGLVDLWAAEGYQAASGAGESGCRVPGAPAAGTNNIKVAGVANFDAGQTIMIDTGTSLKTAVIATVGTAGATTADSSTGMGAIVIGVASSAGFTAGQTITIDSGANQESAIVASTSGGGSATITVAAPLKSAHAVGAQVSGTGITLTAALSRAHAARAPVAGSVPTPGAPNQYYRKGVSAKK